MGSADRRKIDAITAKHAEKTRALRREIMTDMGLPPEAAPEAGNALPRAPRTGEFRPEHPIKVKAKK